MMSATDEIKAVLAAKSAALMAREARALSDIIDPAFIYVNARGSKFSKEEYVATYCRSGLIIIHEQSIDDVEVIEYGDFAIASMTIRDHFEQQGMTHQGLYRSLGAFRRTGGRWLWVAGQTSSV